METRSKWKHVVNIGDEAAILNIEILLFEVIILVVLAQSVGDRLYNWRQRCFK